VAVACDDDDGTSDADATVAPGAEVTKSPRISVDDAVRLVDTHRTTKGTQLPERSRP
jgi:hypothetical protein